MSLDFSLEAVQPTEVFSQNYTHNVTPMWRLAGVYDALYNSHGQRAGDLVDVLTKGLRQMEENPELYQPLNPANGWGNYDTALEFLRDVVQACHAYPDATVYISK